jgi:O-antigen ligase
MYLYIYYIAIIMLMLNVGSLTMNPIIRLIPLFLLFLPALIHSIAFKKIHFRLNKNHWPLVFLLIIMTIGIIRTNNPDTSIMYSLYRIITVIGYSASLLIVLNYIGKSAKRSSKVLNILIIPLTIYLIINLIGHFSGMKSVIIDDLNIGDCVMLSFIGIVYERVLFPFAGGINNHGTVAGVLILISSIILLVKNKPDILKMIVPLFAGIITVLLTDTRAVFIYLFLILTYIVLSKGVNRLVLLRLFPVIGVLGPFIVFLILTLIQDTFLGTLFARSDNDLTQESTRVLIWVSSIEEFISFKPIHLIGFGEMGHYVSGASTQWAQIFSLWSNSEFITPHNSILVVLFDYGYLGLVVFLYSQYIMIGIANDLWKSNRMLSSVIASVVIYWNLIGMTESFFGFYFINTNYMYIAFLAISIWAKEVWVETPISQLNKVSS